MERPSPDDRLEAAAISIKMIAANAPDITPYIDVVMERFAVEETALRAAVGARATERTYERIHANAMPGRPVGPQTAA
jgi:hypothetical protein